MGIVQDVRAQVGLQRLAPLASNADASAASDLRFWEAEFPVRLSEFGIAESTYLGVGVTPEVRVRVVLNVSRAEVTTE